MTAAAKRPRGAASSTPWWRRRQSRQRLWTGFVVLVLAVAVGAVLWNQTQQIAANGAGMAGTGQQVPIGQKVEAVKLEDSRTGTPVDLGQYLGEKDIVLVGYMGYFCLGCRELVAELERRAPEFKATDAELVVLGYETGQTGRNTAQALGVKSYPLLQEGPPNRFTRDIGMWSDHMAMPWMGYLIIDRSGRIVAREQMGLSEAKGAAPANVDALLAALAKAREKSASR